MMIFGTRCTGYTSACVAIRRRALSVRVGATRRYSIMRRVVHKDVAGHLSSSTKSRTGFNSGVDVSVLLLCRINTICRTYCNEIEFSHVPFFLSMSLLGVILGLLLRLGMLYIGLHVICISLFAVLFFLLSWFEQLFIESRQLGRHTKKIKVALVCGFALFLCSEVALFAALFWVLFDRIFASTAFVGLVSFPSGLERIVWYREPLRATLLLLCSGYTANLSYYYLRARHYAGARLWYGASIFLGMLFLMVQYMEYKHLDFDISYSICFSTMYLLTGFHGLHVIIGLVLLSYRDRPRPGSIIL